MWRLAAFMAAIAVAGCGGGERQDADEPEGTFRVEVVEAAFPANQHIAEGAALRIRVRNADSETIPNVAVTVETDPAREGDSPIAFGQDDDDPRLSDTGRPVWIVDRGPAGGDTAHSNTWAGGPLRPGQSKTFLWRVTPVQAGSYTIAYRVAPGLGGRARAEGGDTSGTFDVTIEDEPVPARVGEDGEVIRGEEAGAP
jgi:hypothetical protein